MEYSLKDTRIAKMAAHAVGMDDSRMFKKYGETYFCPFRNFYTAGPDGDGDWEDWVKFGLAEKRNSPDAITYIVTDHGFEWMEKEFDVHFLRDGADIPDFPLTFSDIAYIRDIWSWLQSHWKYTEKYSPERDVSIYMEPDELSGFMARFGDSECAIPARIYELGIVVLFSDLIPFKATMTQIWNLRPSGMREEF